MYDIIQLISEWIINNPYKTIGIVVGFISGLLIVIFGFLKALFIVLFTFAAFLFGKFFDDGNTFRSIINEVYSLLKGKNSKKKHDNLENIENIDIPSEDDNYEDIDLDDI